MESSIPEGFGLREKQTIFLLIDWAGHMRYFNFVETKDKGMPTGFFNKKGELKISPFHALLLFYCLT